MTLISFPSLTSTLTSRSEVSFYLPFLSLPHLPVYFFPEITLSVDILLVWGDGGTVTLTTTCVYINRGNNATYSLTLPSSQLYPEVVWVSSFLYHLITFPPPSTLIPPASSIPLLPPSFTHSKTKYPNCLTIALYLFTYETSPGTGQDGCFLGDCLGGHKLTFSNIEYTSQHDTRTSLDTLWLSLSSQSSVLNFLVDCNTTIWEYWECIQFSPKFWSFGSRTVGKLLLFSFTSLRVCMSSENVPPLNLTLLVVRMKGTMT